MFHLVARFLFPLGSGPVMHLVVLVIGVGVVLVHLLLRLDLQNLHLFHDVPVINLLRYLPLYPLYIK